MTLAAAPALIIVAEGAKLASFNVESVLVCIELQAT